MSTYETDTPPLRGIVRDPGSSWVRRRARARQDEVDRLQVVESIVADWQGGQPPTGAAMVIIDEVAALAIRLRRLRSYGRHRAADELSARLTRAWRSLRWPDAPEEPEPAPAPRPSALEVLSRQASK